MSETSTEPESTRAPAEGTWRYERPERRFRNAPWRRRMRRARRVVLRPIALLFAPPLLRALCATWRRETLHPERKTEYVDGDRSCIAVLWHGRGLSVAPQFRGADARVLVSTSGDGNLMFDFLRRLGYGTLRGSTSRSGARALREMLASLRGAVTVVITPDGPRGPRHSVTRGPAYLARETGLPILPVGLGVDRAWYMRSWDRYTIPKPWARVAVSFGAAIEVPPETPDAELAAIGERIRDSLLSAEREAFEAVGAPVDW